MTEENKNKSVPQFISTITGELGADYWQPQTFQEWSEMAKTTALVSVWVQQQAQERSLRKTIGIWVFVLITLQIISVFALVTFDALELMHLNQTLVQILIPSVLGEVFGMGFIVVKYLFRADATNPFDLIKK